MQEERTGINYEFSWNPFPEKFLSVRYYDHIVRSPIQSDAGSYVLDFPDIDSNAVITHWGISFFVIPIAGGHVELIVELINNMTATLLINQGRVYGYSGINFIPSSWLTLGGILLPNTSFNLGLIRNLAPLSYPITQDESTVRIEFAQTAMGPANNWRIYGRVRGVYAIAS